MHAYLGDDYLSSRSSILVTDDYARMVQASVRKNLHQEAEQLQSLAHEALQVPFTRPGWDFMFLEELISVNVTPGENGTLVTTIRRLPDFTSAKGWRRAFQRLFRPRMETLFQAYLKALDKRLRPVSDARLRISWT